MTSPALLTPTEAVTAVEAALGQLFAWKCERIKVDVIDANGLELSGVAPIELQEWDDGRDRARFVPFTPVGNPKLARYTLCAESEDYAAAAERLVTMAGGFHRTAPDIKVRVSVS